MRRGGVQTTPTQACRFPARMLRARRGYDPPKRDPTCFSWRPKSVQQRRKGAQPQWTLLGQSSTWTWVSMQLSGQFFVETRTRQNFTSLPMPPGQHQQSLTQPKKPPSFPTMRHATCDMGAWLGQLNYTIIFLESLTNFYVWQFCLFTRWS